MKKKISLICLSAIILFSTCSCALRENPEMVEKYNTALSYMSKETNTVYDEFYKYEEAKTMFEELGDFRDSETKAEECYKKSISSAIKIGEDYIKDGNIWGAQNWLTYKFKEMPAEIEQFLQKDIFKLIGDWKLETGGTSLRIDLSSQMGHFDLIAKNGSTYNTGYWKIRNNKLYFCDILLDKENDSNYKKLFTIVSYNKNTLVIKNSKQNFKLRKQ